MPTKVLLVDSKGNPSFIKVEGGTKPADILAACGAEVGAQFELDIPLDRPLEEAGVKSGEIREFSIQPKGSFLRRR